MEQPCGTNESGTQAQRGGGAAAAGNLRLTHTHPSSHTLDPVVCMRPWIVCNVSCMASPAALSCMSRLQLVKVQARIRGEHRPCMRACRRLGQCTTHRPLVGDNSNSHSLPRCVAVPCVGHLSRSSGASASIRRRKEARAAAAAAGLAAPPSPFLPTPHVSRREEGNGSQRAQPCGRNKLMLSTHRSCGRALRAMVCARSQPVVSELLTAAGVNASSVLLDIGCGDGRVPIAAARQCGAAGIGIESDASVFEKAVACRDEAGQRGDAHATARRYSHHLRTFSYRAVSTDVCILQVCFLLAWSYTAPISCSRTTPSWRTASIVRHAAQVCR